MIKVGIIGATGYAGAEIVRLLYSHPEAEIIWYGSRSYVDERFASIYNLEAPDALALSERPSNSSPCPQSIQQQITSYP